MYECWQIMSRLLLETIYKLIVFDWNPGNHVTVQIILIKNSY